jgi:hypothetical protein
MLTYPTTRRRLFAATFIAGLLCAPGVRAETAPVMRFDLPPGPLSASLQSFVRQTHLELLFSPAAMAGRKAPALHGRFTPDEALARLIAGSGFDVEHTSPTVIVVKPHTASPPAEHRADAAETQTCQFARKSVPPFALKVSPLAPSFAVARRRSAEPLRSAARSRRAHPRRGRIRLCF